MNFVYNEGMDEFQVEIQVVSGLVNLHIMMQDRKYREPLECVCPHLE